MDLFTLLTTFLTCLSLITIIVFVCYLLATEKNPNLSRCPSERYFMDTNSAGATKQKFPSIDDSPSISLSVIIPAYNEEERLPIMLDEACDFLEKRQENETNFRYEIIIVDDGSKDKTTKIGLKYSEKYSSEKIRVLTLAKNRGKGGAVRMGMLSSRGKFLLFADADGATHFPEVIKIEEKLRLIRKDDMGVVCGSRSHLEKDAVANRSLFRTILMNGFHALVYVTCVRGINDTQCGFKMFTRNTARLLFTNMHVERWAFDVEILHIAQQYGIAVAEVPVRWEEIAGSKVTPVLSWLQMGRDLVLIRSRYLCGLWNMNNDAKIR